MSTGIGCGIAPEQSLIGDIVVRQHAQGRPFQVIVLPAPQRPQEGSEAEQTEAERGGHKVDEHVHAGLRPACSAGVAGCGTASLRRRAARNALSVTISDEPDMAMAAISGVASPAMATGTAIAL